MPFLRLRSSVANTHLQTETCESLKAYINSNWNHLKEDIISMLAGNRCKISTRKFQNDMVNIKGKDDVSDEFKNAVEDSGWEHVSDTLRISEHLLHATLSKDSATVAAMIDTIHSENTSILSCHDENSLSCIIAIAYYYARKDYTMDKELPAGRGFADIVFRPGKHTDKPAIIVELKWNQSAQGAVQQIKGRQYPQALKEYADELLLVGINYDKKTKKHTCEIETAACQI